MPTVSVADALDIAALPASMRTQLMELVRAAYFAGYATAVRCADQDIEHGMHWRHVGEARVAAAGLWLTAEAKPLLDVDVGCDGDPMYAGVGV